VMGLAMLLSYSLMNIGPVGRAAIGLVTSIVMIGTNWILKQRERYRIFARKLLNRGWAALYFTAYAMHAIEPTKIIQSPFAGACLLFGVATGMIVHSLRYHSQALTALAYFIAFATLAITPVTGFSILALIPLAGSLLVIAHHFNWRVMALLGLIAT